jgi:hypothetical protein
MDVRQREHEHHPLAGRVAGANIPEGSDSLRLSQLQVPAELRRSAPTGRSGVAQRPGTGNNQRGRDSVILQNQLSIQAKDLTRHLSGFIVKQ